MRPLFTALHAAVYRRLGGRFVGSIAGQPVLLLTTTGRRTGQQRTTPVQFVRNDEGFLVVDAAAGAPQRPAWALNLLADPHASVQVGGERHEVYAFNLEAERREEAWELLLRANPRLEGVRSATNRTLDVFLLEPVS